MDIVALVPHNRVSATPISNIETALVPKDLHDLASA